MDLTYFISVLKRRLWIIITIPIIAAITAFYVVRNAPKTYRSNAQLATGLTTDEAVKLTDDRYNAGQTNQNFYNLIERLSSELTISLASYNLILHDLKSDNPFRTPDFTKVDIDPLTPEEKEEAIAFFENKLDSMKVLSTYKPMDHKMLDLLRAYDYQPYLLRENRLIIYRLNNTDYISIDFYSEDPQLSAFVVNTLSKEFIRYNKSIIQSISDESVEFLAQLVSDKKKNLDELKQRVEQFKKSNEVSDFQLESDLKITQLNEYEVKRQEEEENIQALQLSIRSVNNQISRLDNTVIDNSKVLELRNRIRQLNAIYIDGGSQDKEIEKTLNDLRTELQIEMNRISSVNQDMPTKEELESKKDELELQLQVARSNLRSINNRIANLKSDVTGYTSKESNLSVLEQEVENATLEYTDAVNKYNEFKNQSLISGAYIRQTKEGQPAVEPESSNTVIITLAAGAAVFVLIASIIFILELLDFRIKTPAQFSRLTKLPLAGTVNKIDTKKLKLKELFSVDNHDDQFTMFKQLLRKIRFEFESLDAKTILVTSTKVNEGKTFMILCLAYSLSLINKKILIIDTNFKNNSLTQLLVAKPNFERVLKEGRVVNGKLLLNPAKGDEPAEDFVEEEQGYESIVSATAHKNVDIIGSHRGTDSPSEILSGRNFKGMLESLKQDYDYIIMEGASMNDYPDTKELIGYADLVMPVFSAESQIRNSDKESIQYLRSLNGKLMGAILNMVDSKNLKL